MFETLSERLSGILDKITGRGALSESDVEDALREVRRALLEADVALEVVKTFTEKVKAKAVGAEIVKSIKPGQMVVKIVHDALVETLGGAEGAGLNLRAAPPVPILMVGLQGSGKTTTTAKIAKREIADGNKVLLAAADTFRAAAADQLATWADRLGCGVVRGQDGGDPGAVVFDAMDAASARSTDVVIVDTAGRLHTKVNLMRELEKLKRIVERTPGALQEVLLVLDASTGQNGLTQAREFAGAVDITGVVLTKLDGTAKGGIVLAIEDEFRVPVKLVGLGEGADDLVPFDPAEFAAALVE